MECKEIAGLLQWEETGNYPIEYSKKGAVQFLKLQEIADPFADGDAITFVLAKPSRP